MSSKMFFLNHKSQSALHCHIKVKSPADQKLQEIKMSTKGLDFGTCKKNILICSLVIFHLDEKHYLKATGADFTKGLKLSPFFGT